METRVEEKVVCEGSVTWRVAVEGNGRAWKEGEEEGEGEGEGEEEGDGEG